MIIHSSFNIIAVLIFLSLENTSGIEKSATDSTCPQFSPQCTCDLDAIICSNFSSFSELNLSHYNTTKIILSPLNFAILDKNFTLDNLIYPYPKDISIDLVNVLGFDLQTRFYKKQSVQDIQLAFQDSSFRVYIDGELLERENCSWNLIDQNYVSLFNNVSRLILESVTFHDKICPVIFKNVNIDVLYTANVTNLNHFSLSDLSDQNGQNLNSSLNSYFIVQGKFFLDSTFMNGQIFQNLKELIITDSKVLGIENNLFIKLKKIREIALGIRNVGDFFKNGTKWLNSINSDLYVDLNNQTNININLDRQVNYFSIYINQFF